MWSLVWEDITVPYRSYLYIYFLTRHRSYGFSWAVMRDDVICFCLIIAESIAKLAIMPKSDSIKTAKVKVMYSHGHSWKGVWCFRWHIAWRLSGTLSFRMPLGTCYRHLRLSSSIDIRDTDCQSKRKRHRERCIINVRSSWRICVTLCSYHQRWRRA